MHVSLLTGYATSPASFVRQAQGVLNESTGWSLVDTVSGTLLQQDLVFRSSVSGTTYSGTVVAGPFCIRLSGFDEHVLLYGYDQCSVISGTTTYSGEIHDPTASRVFCPPGEFRYWAFSDERHLKFVFEGLGSALHYHGYIGLIDSFYDIGCDPYPLLVFATQSGSRSLGDGQSPVMRYSNGVVGPYKEWVPYSSTFGVPGRVNSCGGMSPILYTTGHIKEVRGRPRGMLKIPPAYAGFGSEYVLASGVYYSFYGSGDLPDSYMYGPVAHGGYVDGRPGCG